MNKSLPIVFTVCDLNYFYRFSESFVKSAVYTGHEVKIIVVTDQKLFDIKPYHDMKEKLEILGGVHIDLMTPDVFESLKNQFQIDDIKAFYANLRFILIYEMMLNIPTSRDCRDVVILDIDSIFNGSIPRIEEDVGLFFREPTGYANEYEKLGMRVAAGIVYIKNSSIGRKFAYHMLEQIFNLRIRWFSDQIALYKNYLNFQKDVKFHAYDQKTLDWDFNDDSLVWSAKGDRKNTNDKYLKKKEEFENGF